MKLYPIKKSDIVRHTNNNSRDSVRASLYQFINSDHTLCKVEDSSYNNNNDLRRVIQHVIKDDNLSIHVFMVSGQIYIEKRGVKNV